MQIYYLIGLTSLIGGVLVIAGTVLGYLIATRSMRFAMDPPRLVQRPSTEQKPNYAPKPLAPPTPPAESGPVKMMRPDEYEAEKQDPLRRGIARIIGVKEPPKP
jgi:hypothetical protein